MSGVQIVFDHVHIICKDPGAAAIREKGGAFAVEPDAFSPGSRIAYLAGPDGGSIELVERQ